MAEAISSRLDEPAVLEVLERLDELLSRLEQMSGPSAETGLDAVAALSQLYGEALARVVDAVAAADAGPPLTVTALASDELIGHLLLLHGLHPASVQARVARALDEVRLQLGGGVELIDIEGGVARVRVTISGCTSSSEELLSAVADALLAAAPELTRVDPVGTKAAAPPPLISVESLMHRPVAVP